MLLLASRGLFVSLIVVAVLVVLLCIGLSVMLYLKVSKIKNTLEADVIKKELYRRETDVVVQIFNDKPDETKREALVNELRRIKSAELIVDEIIKAEKAERGIVDHPHDQPHKPDHSGHGHTTSPAGKGPVPNGGHPAPNGGHPAPNQANRPAGAPAKPAATPAKPAEAPANAYTAKPAEGGNKSE